MNLSAECGNHLLTKRQPHSGAAPIMPGAVKRFKDMGQHIGRYAGAGIGHPQLFIGAVDKKAISNSPRPADLIAYSAFLNRLYNT